VDCEISKQCVLDRRGLRFPEPVQRSVRVAGPSLCPTQQRSDRNQSGSPTEELAPRPAICRVVEEAELPDLNLSVSHHWRDFANEAAANPFEFNISRWTSSCFLWTACGFMVIPS